MKQGPCGQTTNARTANVNVFAPGQTITVRWDEYIDHPAYYRIAFDDDGDDGFVMRTDGQTNPTADNPEAMEAALNMDAEILAIVREDNDTTPGNGTDIRETQVTLPNVTCENCTLQLIQYMYNNPGQGYYQCADIALRAEGGGGETPPDSVDAGAAGSANAGSAGAAGAAGSGGAGGSGTTGPVGAGGGAAPSGTGGTGNTTSSGGTGSSAAGTGSTPVGAAGAGAPIVDNADDSDDGGCTITTHSNDGSASTGLVGLLALGLGMVIRRRR